MINKVRENIWQICFTKSFGSCVYIIRLNKKIIIIDTGSKENKNELLEDLHKLHISPDEIKIVILTHNHWDHIENKDLFSNAKVYNNKNISALKINELKIIKTPGHTQEDICIIYQDVLFSGDTIFNNGSIGRTDFPESSHEKMQKSLEKIKKIDYSILCPGHI